MTTLRKPDEKIRKNYKPTVTLLPTLRLKLIRFLLRHKRLKKASDELDKTVVNLKNALFTQTMEEPQMSFNTP